MYFDVVVVGGGHAGCEAAVAAARLGRQTALICFTKAQIGRLSCNPAVGGLAKGCLVREIDALGGIQAQITDQSTIQFRRSLTVANVTIILAEFTTESDKIAALTILRPLISDPENGNTLAAQFTTPEFKKKVIGMFR